MSFLDDMVAARKSDIFKRYAGLCAADRERLACCSRAPRDFLSALENRADVAVIAEVKKCSPSAGKIAPSCEASKQALHYQDGGAACISVLTEPVRFGGSFADLSDVADAVDVPVLCKDFVVDPVQLFLARGHGADAVLLMVSILGENVGEYMDAASTLGLTTLVEVHDAAELDIAMRASAALIGVNARDLRTLEVSAEKVERLVSEAKSSGALVVAESGTRDRPDVVRAARAGADAVLVGEVLMRADFPEDVLEQLTGVKKVPVQG